jgi:hypothetical protein
MTSTKSKPDIAKLLRCGRKEQKARKSRDLAKFRELVDTDFEYAEQLYFLMGVALKAKAMQLHLEELRSQD